MTYLIAKFAFVFLIAAAFGFLFGRWLTRRRFVDVSESHDHLFHAADGPDSKEQWERLWRRLDAISGPGEENLPGVSERLDLLAFAVTNIPKPDLQPLNTGLALLREDVQRLSVVTRTESVDVEPIRLQIESLDKKIRAIPLREAIDLDPIDHRLDAIESHLGALDRQLVEPESSPPVLISAALSESATVTAATHGEKDNLRRIQGVGPKLEGLLNKNGVFYFWQIADWTQQEIDQIDERLDTFKGRINRDNWVSQSKQFSAEPSSARRPATIQNNA